MLGVIDATIWTKELKNLTLNRSLPAIPFAGRYRLIDFILSNMVNAGIESVAIFPKHKYRSLMDHLGSGKSWDLDRKRDGLFFFPSKDGTDERDFGTFRQMMEHIDYFLRSKQKYALVANSYVVGNIDFSKVLAQHIKRGCDITVISHEGKPLNMYVLETSLLLDILANHEQAGHETLQDVINDSNNITINKYKHEGYVAIIDSIEAYFKHSMELLDPKAWKQLFDPTRRIYTKVKDEPPTYYKKDAVVKNALIANGCKIEGTIESSIIFRGVRIGKNSMIKNSVIMQKSQVGENCILENVIIDKDVRVENDVKIIGTAENPYVIRKGTIQGALMNS